MDIAGSEISKVEEKVCVVDTEDLDESTREKRTVSCDQAATSLMSRTMRRKSQREDQVGCAHDRGKRLEVTRRTTFPGLKSQIWDEDANIGVCTTCRAR